MTQSEKQISQAVFAIGEALQLQDERLAQLEADVRVVKGFLAAVMNRSNPAEALAGIEAKSKEAMEKAPGAADRAKISELLDLLKLIEKHGPPRES